MDLDGRDARLGLDGPSFHLSIPHDVSEAFVAWFDAEFADGSVGERGLGTSGQSLSFSFFAKYFPKEENKEGETRKTTATTTRVGTFQFTVNFTDGKEVILQDGKNLPQRPQESPLNLFLLRAR